jgi:glycerol kinase
LTVKVVEAPIVLYCGKLRVMHTNLGKNPNFDQGGSDHFAVAIRMGKYILAIDQGTTSCRALVFDSNAQLKSVAQKEFTQYYPQPGWVEHDALEIWTIQLAMVREAIRKAGITAADLVGIGITNQRETTVVWDRATGQPIHRAIVWQDRRTAAICDRLKADGLEAHIREATGLVADAYFSGTKLHWILAHVPGAQARAAAGELCFGTIDTWLIWNLTGGQVHATDYSNASRTLMYDIRQLQWDPVMLQALDIPAGILPKVQDSAGHFGDSLAALLDGVSVPILGVAGDQQAALFGQACFSPGMSKNTYGTGCFMLMNTGQQLAHSKHGLLSTIAWGIDGHVEYALEGSVFVAGAAIQWLRDGLHLIDTAADSEYFAQKVADAGGVYVVPAFTGLGAPYWDMYARGAVFGLTRGSGKSELIRATLEAIAYQTRDVLSAMEQDAGVQIKLLRVDGGATHNNFLMQFQADILDVQVERPAILETTAMGAAFLAGIAAGLWDKTSLTAAWQRGRHFDPQMGEETRHKLYRGWKKAVQRALAWEEED